MRRLSLSSRLALLFAACTAVVSLFAGVLFSRASEAHFIELDQQLLDGKLIDNASHLARLERSVGEIALALPETIDRIQEIHIKAIHILILLVEQLVSGGDEVNG